MRPPREDIAAPPFPPGLEWVGGPEPQLDRLVASGPLLVHFFDIAQLNSVRALPYVAAWRSRYGGDGLSVLGVHSSRLSLSRDPAAVEAALPGLGIDWPVALDGDLRAFRDYGCRGWPSLFLWGRGGALRWYHLGEGEYTATEEAIREQLSGGEEREWPPTLKPLRPGDAPGATVIAPTPELFPGGAEGEPWLAGNRDALEFSYAAAGASAAAEGEGKLTVLLDGEPAGSVEVRGPGLYELAASETHGEHSLRVEAAPGVAIHSIQFPPGPAAS
jgi:hypothetical protein